MLGFTFQKHNENDDENRSITLLNISPRKRVHHRKFMMESKNFTIRPTVRLQKLNTGVKPDKEIELGTTIPWRGITIIPILKLVRKKKKMNNEGYVQNIIPG